MSVNSKISIIKQIFSYRAYQRVEMRSNSSCKVRMDDMHCGNICSGSCPLLKLDISHYLQKILQTQNSHQKIATIARGCKGSISCFTITSNNAKIMWKAMFELEKSKWHSILWSLVGIYKIRMFLEFQIIPTIVVGVATIVVNQTATISMGL